MTRALPCVGHAGGVGALAVALNRHADPSPPPPDAPLPSETLRDIAAELLAAPAGLEPETLVAALLECALPPPPPQQLPALIDAQLASDAGGAVDTRVRRRGLSSAAASSGRALFQQEDTAAAGSANPALPPPLPTPTPPPSATPPLGTVALCRALAARVQLRAAADRFVASGGIDAAFSVALSPAALDAGVLAALDTSEDTEAVDVGPLRIFAALRRPSAAPLALHAAVGELLDAAASYASAAALPIAVRARVALGDATARLLRHHDRADPAAAAAAEAHAVAACGLLLASLRNNLGVVARAVLAAPALDASTAAFPLCASPVAGLVTLLHCSDAIAVRAAVCDVLVELRQRGGAAAEAAVAAHLAMALSGPVETAGVAFGLCEATASVVVHLPTIAEALCGAGAINALGALMQRFLARAESTLPGATGGSRLQAPRAVDGDEEGEGACDAAWSALPVLGAAAGVIRALLASGHPCQADAADSACRPAMEAALALAVRVHASAPLPVAVTLPAGWRLLDTIAESAGALADLLPSLSANHGPLCGLCTPGTAGLAPVIAALGVVEADAEAAAAAAAAHGALDDAEIEAAAYVRAPAALCALLRNLATVDADAALALSVAGALPPLLSALQRVAAFMRRLTAGGVTGPIVESATTAASLAAEALLAVCAAAPAAAAGTPRASEALTSLIGAFEGEWRVQGPAFAALRHVVEAGGPSAALAAADAGIYDSVVRSLRRTARTGDADGKLEDLMVLLRVLVDADAAGDVGAAAAPGAREAAEGGEEPPEQPRHLAALAAAIPEVVRFATNDAVTPAGARTLCALFCAFFVAARADDARKPWWARNGGASPAQWRPARHVAVCLQQALFACLELGAAWPDDRPLARAVCAATTLMLPLYREAAWPEYARLRGPDRRLPRAVFALLDAHAEDAGVARCALAFIAHVARDNLSRLVSAETGLPGSAGGGGLRDASLFAVLSFSADPPAAVATVLAALRCHALEPRIAADALCVLHWLVRWGDASVPEQTLGAGACTAALMARGGVAVVARALLDHCAISAVVSVAAAAAPSAAAAAVGSATTPRVTARSYATPAASIPTDSSSEEDEEEGDEDEEEERRDMNRPAHTTSSASSSDDDSPATATPAPPLPYALEADALGIIASAVAAAARSSGGISGGAARGWGLRRRRRAHGSGGSSGGESDLPGLGPAEPLFAAVMAGLLRLVAAVDAGRSPGAGARARFFSAPHRELASACRTLAALIRAGVPVPPSLSPHLGPITAAAAACLAGGGDSPGAAEGAGQGVAAGAAGAAVPATRVRAPDMVITNPFGRPRVAPGGGQRTPPAAARAEMGGAEEGRGGAGGEPAERRAVAARAAVAAAAVAGAPAAPAAAAQRQRQGGCSVQ